MNLELQSTSQEIWEQKYQLKDHHGNPVDKNLHDSYERVAKALAGAEQDKDYWLPRFIWALENGATPAGRIMSNAGAGEFKPATSLINCTVSQIIEDSMEGIMIGATESAKTLKAGCGIGYEFSTLRPRGAFINGAGATTSGAVGFMDIYDSMCFTVSSAGGRRGAQMGTFAVWHPDVEEFIKAKRENGRLRQFNLSLLIDTDFMNAVKDDSDYDLVFPITHREHELFGYENAELTWRDLFWDADYCEQQGYIVANGKIRCKIYRTVKATELWDTIMKSTYDFAEPGFLLIDEINRMNPLSAIETIRATNPCGEQPLPPHGSCLLGSINLAKFVVNPCTDEATFDENKFIEVVRIFTRMLDNVVELNGLPLPEQRHEIESKRRHGMGFLGLGSALALLGVKYGSKESVNFTNFIMRTMAVEGFRTGIELAREKGAAPIFNENLNLLNWAESPYMQRIWTAAPELQEEAYKYGCRFTHHTSIAPTGTISLSLNNNTSNGIEPTFAHKYTRNVIKEGKNSKQAVDVYSYEGLVWKEIHGNEDFPECFSTTDTVTPYEHVDIQAIAQYWCDSSISKTINVPTDMPFEAFKDIYLYAYDQGLKGCTTFRFNPEAFQGVLVKESDLEATEYVFVLEDGSEHVLKGNTKVTYEGEEHSAANLYDALKEGYYGKF